MKFRIKLLCMILLLLILSGGVVFYTLFVTKKTAEQLEPVRHGQLLLQKKHEEKYSKLELERYSSFFEENFSAAETPAVSLLAENIRQAAVTLLKNVLPEKSVLLTPLDIELLDDHSALVCCRAVIFTGGKLGERKINCRLRVNYLSDGSCEAEYPDFLSDK